MSVNYLAVFIASVAEFILGAIWYMPIFGKLWGKIHGFKKMSKEEQKESQKKMAPMLLVQFIVTVVTTLILAKLIVLLPQYSAYALVTLLWVGFVIPTQVAAVIFGGTDSKWVVTKTLIMAGGSALCLLAATAILRAM